MQYSCYLCGAEFMTLRGQEKHHQFGKCPRITKEMHEESMQPFFRVLTEVSYVDPKLGKNKEKFQYSLNVETQFPYIDIREKLIKNAEQIALSLQAQSSMKDRRTD